MDWRRFVRTSVISLTSLLVGEPVMVGKSDVALPRRFFSSSGEVMVSWDEGRKARGLDVFYDDK